MITTVTGKNQVTVPAKIAAAEDIEAGTRLDWRLTAKEHVLEVRILPDRATLARQLRGAGREQLEPGRSPVAELIRERESEDEERRALQ